MSKIILVCTLIGVLFVVLSGTVFYVSMNKTPKNYLPSLATSSLPLVVTSKKGNVPPVSQSTSSATKTGVGPYLQQQFAATLFNNENPFLMWQNGGLDFSITNVLVFQGHGDSVEGPIELPPRISILFTAKNNGKNKASGTIDLKMLRNGTSTVIFHKDYIDVEPGITINDGAPFYDIDTVSPLEFVAGPESHTFFTVTKSGDGKWIVAKNISSTNEVFKQNPSTPPVIIKIHDLYPVNLSDDRLLMGASHNVFVAKVIRKIGNKRKFTSPETQFEVGGVSSIKGNLQGTIIVDQEGGYENGALYYVEDGAPLLQPGSTYLLSARYDSQENWYELISFLSAWKLLNQDASLTATQLQTLVQNDPRVQQLEAIYPNEILLQADIAHNTTLNSYQSLTEAQKAALPYYAPPPPPPPPPPAPTSTTSVSASTTPAGM